MAVRPLLPRVAQVEALEDFVLRIEFKDGLIKLFDVKPYLGLPAFRRLREGMLFFKAHVSHGTVVWDDQLDLSPDTLYLDGVLASVASHQ
jgi:hypothetical protein